MNRIFLKCTKIIARNVMNQARCCAAQRVVFLYLMLSRWPRYDDREEFPDQDDDEEDDRGGGCGSDGGGKHR